MKLTCVWCIFRFISKFVQPRLLLNMQNNENNCEGAEIEERKKNKILISSSKREFGKGSFLYDIRKKIPKICTPTPPPPLYPFFSPYPQTSNILVLAQLTLGCTNIYYSHKHKTDRKADRLSPTRLLLMSHGSVSITELRTNF